MSEGLAVAQLSYQTTYEERRINKRDTIKVLKRQKIINSFKLPYGLNKQQPHRLQSSKRQNLIAFNQLGKLIAMAKQVTIVPSILKNKKTKTPCNFTGLSISQSGRLPIHSSL
jgi:uncharacterized protein YueI